MKTSNEAERGKPWFSLSILFLAAANVVPLLGVMYGNWSAFQIALVYWMENLVLGGINVLKMAVCSPDLTAVSRGLFAKAADKDLFSKTSGDMDKLADASRYLDKHGSRLMGIHHLSKLFLIPFFILHYGGFCLGHGMFILVLLGPAGPGDGSFDFSREALSNLVGDALAGGTGWAAAGILASHLLSFFMNYIGKGEFRRTAVPALMLAPYGRIAILHIAIVFGAFMIMKQGSPVVLLALLVIGKTLIDAGLHVRSHRRLR